MLVGRNSISFCAHFRVAVLDQAASLGDEAHGLHAILGELVERCALVVTLLVGHFVDSLVIGDDVILQLAHGFHLQACGLLEHFVGLV